MKRLELRVTLEDLMESPTFKKFNAAIDSVLEAAEDIDLTELRLGKISIIYILTLSVCKITG